MRTFTSRPSLAWESRGGGARSGAPERAAAREGEDHDPGDGTHAHHFAHIGVAAGAPMLSSAPAMIQRTSIFEAAVMIGGQSLLDRGAGLIVDDKTEKLTRGQMRKGDFFPRMSTAIRRTAEAELARAKRSADGCPYLERWLAHYQDKPAAHLERAIRRYAPASMSATRALDYLEPLTAKLAASIARWANTGEIPSAPDDEGGGDGGPTGGKLLPKLHGPGAPPQPDARAVAAQLGAGQPLPASVRGPMERALDFDFAHVRIHTDGGAAQLSQDLAARAFTVGSHVAFGADQFRPGDPRGDALLAHELAHVAQQHGGGDGASSVDAPGALEAEADGAAAAAVAAIHGTERDVARAPATRPSRGRRVQLSRCSTSTPLPQTKGKGGPPPPPTPTQTQATPAGKDASGEAAATPDAAPPASPVDAWLEALPDAKVRDKVKPGGRVEGRFDPAQPRSFMAKGPLTEYRWDSGKPWNAWDPKDPTPIPEFKYREDKGQQLAADLPESKARDDAAAQVATARSRIAGRFFVPRNQFITGIGESRGLEWSGQADVITKLKASGRTKEIETFENYRQWLTRTMKDKRDPAAKTGGAKIKDVNAVNKVLRSSAGAEGEPSSINAWDRMNVTWGPGITGVLFPRLINSVMEKNDDAKQAFLAAGITTAPAPAGGNRVLVVADTDRKWKLSGVDAELYLRSKPELLSLFVNIAQGYATGLEGPANDDMRMAVLDAQIEIIQSISQGSHQISWASEDARLEAFHSVMGGRSWDLFVKKQAALKGAALKVTDVDDALRGVISTAELDHLKTK